MPDSSSGIGIGTPIDGPAAAAEKGVYRPPAKTLLSLSRYAEIMGINPMRFMGGDADTSSPPLFPTVGLTALGDRDIWFQYSWQDSNKISRNELARQIADTERDIMIRLGTWPAPVWVESENVRYDRYHRPEYTALRGYTPDGRFKSVKLRQNKFIVGGERALTFVGTPAVVFSDEDTDGFNETITITQATALTDICELKVYYAGFSGDPRYEIRPIRSKSISGGNAIFVIDSWLLFDPERLSAYPGPVGPTPLSVSAAANYVSTVDVYREYNDPENQCTFKWDGAPQSCGSCSGAGCPQCSVVTQIGCFLASDQTDLGYVRPAPASAYSAPNFTVGWFCTGREPNWLTANYKCGIQEDPDGNGCYEVPDDLAKAIAYMATARLSKPLCTTSENVSALEKWLREDLAYYSVGRGADVDIKFVTSDVMNNPLGTRRGEVEAWRVVRSRQKIGQMRANVGVF